MSEVNRLPARIPFVDLKTGELTLPAFKFINQIINRVGGNFAPTNNELDNGLQFDVRESEAAELTKRINDLERLFHISDTSAAVAQLSSYFNSSGVPTFMQETEPTEAPSIWFKTDGTGRVIDIMQVTP